MESRPRSYASFSRRAGAARRVAGEARTRLGPEEFAMMTVFARVFFAVTRAWTFTPAKAEEEAMIAAILCEVFRCARETTGAGMPRSPAPESCSLARSSPLARQADCFVLIG